MAWAVIPFRPGAVLADINVGLLYILAISRSASTAWSSRAGRRTRNIPSFQRMRAAAQMISYEVSIGFILICVVLWAGSFNLNGDHRGAARPCARLRQRLRLQPAAVPDVGGVPDLALAETARAPFDLTEAESELVAGYQTEYSSMSFALFWLGEYANVLLMCALNAILFWGGWLPPLDWAPLYCDPRHHLAVRQDPVLLLRLHLGEGDRAALPLRPADAAGLEDVPAALAALRVSWCRGYLMLTRVWSSVMTVAQLIKSFTLWEFVKAHCADVEVFLQAQGDDQLSVREEPALARASAASMRCAAIPTARSAASRASCARRCARRRRSRSRPSRARTAAAAPRATTST